MKASFPASQEAGFFISHSSYQDWQQNKQTYWYIASIPIVCGLIVPKLSPTNHDENNRWLKPVETFANQHDNHDSEYGELRSDKKY